MSAFLSAEFTSRSVETRRASPAFMAVFKASLMLSRSTGQPHVSGRSGGLDPPAAERDERPDRLDQPERPSALQEPIDRAERASHRERQDVPPTALLQRIEEQHRGDGKQAKSGQKIHQSGPFDAAGRGGYVVRS